jgi:hypothetical protein
VAEAQGALRRAHVEMAERAIQYLAAGTPSSDLTVSVRGELILRQSSGG